MNGHRRRLIAAAALPAVVALAGCASPSVQGGRDRPGRRSVTLLHVNDSHGRYQPLEVEPGNATAQTGDPGREPETFERPGRVGGYAALATAVADARRRHGAGHVLLMHGGDTFSDDLLGNLTRGEATVRLMNELGFDAMALGNHDFDYGLERTRELQSMARFPMRANVIDESDGRPLFGQPWLVVERGGVRVGLLFLGYHNTGDTGSRKNLRGLRFTSGVEAAAGLIPQLRSASDVTVVLSHQGSAIDRVLARSVPGIDVIVGGHSHDRIGPPERIGQTWLVQALSDLAALGELTLTLAPDGRLEGVEGQVRTLWHAQWPPDPRIAALVASLRAPYRVRLEEVLAHASARIGRHYRSPSPFDTLVGDLLRAHTGAEVALLPGVGYGVSLGPGPITREALYTLLPHPTKATTLTLSGSQILEVLEQSATNQRPADPLDRVGGLIQTSGLRWTIDLTRPVGQRISGVAAGGRPIEPQRPYRIVTHEGLAGGLHRYHAIGRGLDIRTLDEEVVEIVEAALRHAGTVAPPATAGVTLIRA